MRGHWRGVCGLSLLALVSCGGSATGERDGGAGNGGKAGAGGGAARGGDGGGSGGTAAGGASGSDGGAACAAFTPCGGDLVGTWQITQTCFSTREDLSGSCGGADVWVTGTWMLTGSITYNADHTYMSNLSGTDLVHYHYPTACLAPKTCDEFGQTLTTGGINVVSCSVGLGAGTCDCEGEAPLHVQTDAGSSGMYSTSGTMLANGDAGTSGAAYCVEGNVLHERGTYFSAADGGTTLPVYLVFTRQ